MFVTSIYLFHQAQSSLLDLSPSSLARDLLLRSRLSARPLEPHPYGFLVGSDAAAALSTVSVRDVLAGASPPPPPSSWVFLDPAAFTPGSLSGRLPAWTEVLRGNPDGPMILEWLENGVSYGAFARAYRGRFAGVSYSAGPSRPPARVIPNRPSLYDDAHIVFVRAEIAGGLRSGGMRCLGPVATTPAPTVVCPLGVEPKKPRLIYDARYINLWQSPPPFAFDSLMDLARAAADDSLLTVWDHKSGYFHIRLHPDSQQ